MLIYGNNLKLNKKVNNLKQNKMKNSNLKVVVNKKKLTENSCGGQGCKITILPTYIKKLKVA